MKDIFYFPRFWNFARKHYSENLRRYLTIESVLTGIFLVSFLIFYIASQMLSRDTLEMFVVCGGILGTVAFVWYQLQDYNSRRYQISLFTAPASVLEKYLLIWVNTLIVAPVLYIVPLWIVNTLMEATVNFSIHPFKGTEPRVWFLLLLMFASIQAVSLLLRTTFKKYMWLACLYPIAAFFILLKLPSLVARMVSGGAVESPFTLSFNAYRRQWIQFDYIRVDRFFDSVYFYTAIILSLIVFWVVGYYKFKEHQLKG